MDHISGPLNYTSHHPTVYFDMCIAGQRTLPDKKTVPFRDERRPENKVCESEIYNVYGICYLRDLLLSELRDELEEPDELRLPEEDGLDSDLPDETDELLLL